MGPPITGTGVVPGPVAYLPVDSVPLNGQTCRASVGEDMQEGKVFC